MFARRVQTKRRGQSLPLLALIIVVLFGMVGLAVDVGNTYAEQRNADRVTTAAALAGMDTYLRDGSTDANVASVIAASYSANNMSVITAPDAVVQPGQNWMRAFYLDDFGNPICQVGRCNNKPAGVKYIQVRLSGSVETYFARVVNRPTLNVEAQAFAGQCTPSDGVYPIAIQTRDLDSKGFIKPSDPTEQPYYKNYSDENYPTPRPQRRIYLKDNGENPGSFSFLRWKADVNTSGSQQELENMFRGDGNLDEGYSEWLDNQGKPSWPGTSAKPNGYPQLPRQFNAGDWIAGNPGLNGQSLVSIFQQHINARTEMLLPIIDESAGGGNNGAYHVNRLGVFLLRAYGNQPGKGWYMDMVYLKNVKNQTCQFENLPTTSNPLRIYGPVSVRPIWKEPQQSDKPVAYQMVMDTSGSMSYNFSGEGWLNGSGAQCELPDNNYDPSKYRYPIRRCEGGPSGYWNVKEERRVHITKTAMAAFIDKMNPADTMQIIKFTTDGSGPVDVNGDGKADSKDWSSDKNALKAAVLKAGSYRNDPYLTAGGTPGPQAIKSADTMLRSGAPKVAPDGREYRPVTIYLTDGVANVFVNGQGNDARDICPDIYRAFSDQATANTVTKNTPRCQIGYSESYGQERPITSMITLAGGMKRANPDLALYVVALAGVNATGLDQVSTNPSMTYLATHPSLVKTILEEINAEVENGKCISRVGTTDVQVIDNAHTATGFGNPAGVHGYVEIFDQSGQPLPNGKGKLPIKHDPVTGLLGFRQEAGDSIAPGLYQMIAYVYYKGDDGVSRQYDKMYDRKTGTNITRLQFEIVPDNGLGGEVAIDPVIVEFKSGNVCPT